MYHWNISTSTMIYQLYHWWDIYCMFFYLPMVGLILGCDKNLYHKYVSWKGGRLGSYYMMLSVSVNTILRLVSNHHWSRFMEHIQRGYCSPKSPPSHLDIPRNLTLDGMLKRRSRSQTTNFGVVEKPRRHEAASFTTSPNLSSCSKG